MDNHLPVVNTTELQYDDQLEKLLKEQAEIAESLSILHRNAHRKYNRLTNLINIPVIIGSSVVGFTTGLDLSTIDNINVILGIISVFIGVIKSLDSYFQLGRTSETHRMVSLAYSQINKKIAIELALSRNDRISPKDMLAIVKSDVKNLEDISPLLPSDILKSYSKEFGSKYLDVKKPNITNGLSPVEVNKTDYSDARRRFTVTGNLVVPSKNPRSEPELLQNTEDLGAGLPKVIGSEFRRRFNASAATLNQAAEGSNNQETSEDLNPTLQPVISPETRRLYTVTANLATPSTNAGAGLELSEYNPLTPDASAMEL